MRHIILSIAIIMLPACGSSSNNSLSTNNELSNAVAVVHKQLFKHSNANSKKSTKHLLDEVNSGDCGVNDQECEGVMRELWKRGYCTTDVQGHIDKCTKEEIENDKKVDAALGNM